MGISEREFRNWLHARAVAQPDEAVGTSLVIFGGPLSKFLRHTLGCPVAVDGARYYPIGQSRTWATNYLPLWARTFMAQIDRLKPGHAVPVSPACALAVLNGSWDFTEEEGEKRDE